MCDTFECTLNNYCHTYQYYEHLYFQMRFHTSDLLWKTKILLHTYSQALAAGENTSNTPSSKAVDLVFMLSVNLKLYSVEISVIRR